MITAEFTKNSLGSLTGFRFYGHADYAEEGYDIICSAVSALSLNTVNSITELLHEKAEAEVQEDGFLACCVQDPENPYVQLLLKSLELGIRSVEQSYGSKYITVHYSVR